MSQLPRTNHDYFNFQTQILKGQKTNSEILELFTYVEQNPLSIDNFLEIYKASKIFTAGINVNCQTFDITGTGGDLADTFNISTIAAILASSCGQAVAKHGNRASSSQVGSADLLEGLGIKIDLDKVQARKALEENGFVFLFAPSFNPSFRFAKEARKIFKKQTYFNFLGPLLNPANPEFSLVGCAKREMVNFMGEALVENGTKKAWVTYSEAGINEISPCGKTFVTEFTANYQKSFELTPADFGLKASRLEEIESKDLAGNLEIARNIFTNQATPAQTDAVLINVAAGLFISEKANDLKKGMEIARRALESGNANKKLQKLQNN